MNNLVKRFIDWFRSLLPGLLLTLWFGRPTDCDEEDVPVVNISSNANVDT